MKKFLKQLFCSHPSIKTETKSWSPDNCFIVSTLIKCDNCEKTFAQHPHANCCYVQHVHNDLMRDYWIEKIKKGMQQ